MTGKVTPVTNVAVQVKDPYKNGMRSEWRRDSQRYYDETGRMQSNDKQLYKTGRARQIVLLFPLNLPWSGTSRSCCHKVYA